MTIDRPLDHQMNNLRTLWKEAFGDTDEFLDTFFSTAFSADRCRCVTSNHSVVAVLYWFDCFYEDQKLAYVYAVATACSHRGQGFSHKLMENTHAHLKSLGYDGVLLVPGSESLFHFYESMGYQTCTHIQEFSCEAKKEDTRIQEINHLEYAQLRPQYLPSGSVIQEQENLDFLNAQARFYAGDDFLLAASLRGNRLFGIELLGDTSVAPQILNTLGYKKGTFRSPGCERPFAMYYPLKKADAFPSYFGFAFD